MGRFSRKLKKELGKESVTSILNSGRTIAATKAAVRRERISTAKTRFINNNLDKLPQNYSQELLNMAVQQTNSINTNISTNTDTDTNTNINTNINTDINIDTNTDND